MAQKLTARMLLSGYAQGIFPMAESRDAPELHWFDPQRRGIFDLQNFYISRSLARAIRRETFTIRTDTAFRAVVEGCAARPETWINGPLFDLYDELFAAGFAHSVETWRDGQLVGGVYGITLGGAFFGESMFSRATNASKVALAYTVDRLRVAGFTLFDTQYLTPHLASLGATEIPRAEYRKRLEAGLEIDADFTAPAIPDPHSILQRMTQTS
ncbi:leucyl/phenylalanyl-tRNA--protein transferase [Sinirhodobacter sp. WL0062]|uniref:Leucyl/phenylalanyl-tRNA--protein transferase n=1 Tax=Rhodobacter flavimaris TaxID=2907145 RepID=A0ABS8YYE8_9RHOB|nr:leucyl/phenylalanyl-tRNA--protein transferase [Sinirhodobacter sp. WL0062]MCE5974842.1 leucyl/phenylalanyl-tRNA--protein transferase [Sinirhodobacter sp. WL0062]